MINKQWIAWYLPFEYFAPGGLGRQRTVQAAGGWGYMLSPPLPALAWCFFSYVICHLYVFLNLLNLNIGDTSLNDKFLTTTCHASYICFHVISHQVVSSPSCLLLPSDLILPVPSPPSPIIQQTFRKIRNFLTNAWGQSQVGDID